MKCPNCQSSQIRKNGHRRGKQNYHCKECDRQFINHYTARGYSNEVKKNCLQISSQNLYDSRTKAHSLPHVGENTRLRHYLARLKRKTLCYSKSEQMLRLSIKLLPHYLYYKTIPL